MTTLNLFIAIFAIFISISGYLASEGNIDDDYYELAILNLIKQKQYLLNQKQQQLNQELKQFANPARNVLIDTEKRGKACIKRNAVCDGRLQDQCCSGSTCRCSLIGPNVCRCQRPGLFQKFF